MKPLLARLPFALLLAVRSHAGRHRILSALTVLAIATSVALATGLEIASRSVEVELERTADELAGAAEIEITGGSLGVPEVALARAAAVPGVRVAVPLLEVTVRIATGPAAGEVLHVLGVDLLADPDVRTYAWSGAAVELRDPLRMLARSDSLIVTEAFAGRFGIAPSEVLPVRASRGELALVVQGLLAAGGVADAFGGQIAVMDVYALQSLLGREGWLDRIDVVVAKGFETAPVVTALAAALDGVASVRRSAARDVWVDNTIGTVRLVVWALVAVAVLAASLLAYGTLSLFVDRRMLELALLRTVGLEARRLRRILHVDALLLATIGSGLGLVLGLALARSFLSVFSGISALLQDVQIERLELESTTVAIAAAIGIGVALLAGFEPARRASAQAPLEVLGACRAPGERAPTSGRRKRQAGLALAFAIVASAPLGLAASARVALLFGLGLLLVASAARDPLPAWLRSARPVFERIFPHVGRLVGSALVARPTHTGITVAAVAGVLAGVTVSGILAQSLTRTLDAWTANQYPNGIFVAAGSPLALRDREPIAPDVVEIIRETPGVAAVFDHFTADTLFRGEEVLLSAGSMAVLADHGRLPVVEGDPREVARAVAHGEAAVSDGFAHRFGVERGDAIELDTPQGRREFRVAGVIRDYAGPAGSINLDVAVFDALWGREGSSNLVVWAAPPAEVVIEAIKHRVGEREALFFVHGADLDRYASRILSRFTRLLDLVAVLTAVLGGLAVMNLLLGAVIERRRELALLRSAGATRRQVATLIVLDGLLVGILGGVAGIGLGLLCAHPMVSRIIPEALGWSLTFSVDAGRLGLLVGGVGIASLAASFYPAWTTRRVLPREVFAPE